MLAAPGCFAGAECVGENEVRHLLQHPLKVVFLDREVVEIGGRIQEVDGVEDVVTHRELDGVHVVPQSVDEDARLLDGLIAQGAGGRVRDLVALFERRARVVADGEDVLAPDADAAHVVLPVDELLQDHRLQAAGVVGGDQLLDGVDDVHVLPASPGVRLEHRRQPGVGDDAFPVQRMLKVAQRLLVVDVGDVLLVGQDHGLGHRDAELARQRAFEELLIRLPPEGVVDDDGAHQRGALEVGAVVGDLVRDAVDDDGVRGFFELGGAAQHRQLRAHALGRATLVDHVDEGQRKRVFAPDQDSDFLCSHRRPLIDYCER